MLSVNNQAFNGHLFVKSASHTHNVLHRETMGPIAHFLNLFLDSLKPQSSSVGIPFLSRKDGELEIWICMFICNLHTTHNSFSALYCFLSLCETVIHLHHLMMQCRCGLWSWLCSKSLPIYYTVHYIYSPPLYVSVGVNSPTTYFPWKCKEKLSANNPLMQTAAFHRCKNLLRDSTAVNDDTKWWRSKISIYYSLLSKLLGVHYKESGDWVNKGMISEIKVSLGKM